MSEIKQNITSTEPRKIKRKNFFFYSGSAILGLFALSKYPLKFFETKISKETTIKITANPSAVKRKPREANNG